MKTIYIVRHGETDSNAASLLQDGTSVLSEKGKQQAHLLADRLQHLKHEHIIVSDYIRTRQTVAPLLEKTTIMPIYSPLLREIRRPTQFIGTSNKSFEYKDYKNKAGEHVADPYWYFADEENFFDIKNRIDEFMKYVDTLDGNIIAISHGRFITFLTLYIITGGNITPDIWQSSMHNLAMKNTGITAICYDTEHQHWLLKTFNDHSHFAE